MKKLWLEYSCEVSLPIFLLGLVFSYGIFDNKEQFVAVFPNCELVLGGISISLTVIGLIGLIFRSYNNSALSEEN